MAVIAMVPTSTFLGQQLLLEPASALPLQHKKSSVSPSSFPLPIQNALSSSKPLKNRVVRTPATAQKGTTLTAPPTPAALLPPRSHTQPSFYQIFPLPSRIDRSILESQWALNLSDPLPEIVTAEIARLRDLYSRPSSPRPLSVPILPHSPVRVKGTGPARQRRIQARQVKLSARPGPTDPRLFSLRDPKKSELRRITFAKGAGAGAGSGSGQEAGPGVLGSYLNSTGRVKLLTKEEEILLSTRLQSTMVLWSSRGRLTSDLGREPNDAEWAHCLDMSVAELKRHVREGQLAKEKLILANLRLVVSVAKRFQGNGMELMDLIQAGNLGLSRGVEKFDPKRGYRLSTYVHWWIRQSMNRALSTHSRLIRVPVNVHESMGKIRRTRRRLEMEAREGKVAVTDIARALGLKEAKVENVIKAQYCMWSMDVAVNKDKYSSEEGETPHHFMADEGEVGNPCMQADADMLRSEVAQLLAEECSMREREIIKLHFGIGRRDGIPITLEAISLRLGISRERARQLEMVAMRRLAVAAEKRELDLYQY